MPSQAVLLAVARPWYPAQHRGEGGTSACSAGRTDVTGRAGGRLSIATGADPRNPGLSKRPFCLPGPPCESHARPVGLPDRQHGRAYVSSMAALREQLVAALAKYEKDNDLGALFDSIRALVRTYDLDDLIAVADEHRDRHEVVIPVYEEVTARRPHDAHALVVLANAYWLTGRGPEVVGELATRAREADPGNRGAWHLWALSESDVRGRMERWQQVTNRFPSDLLARAALADNAASLAGAEHDPLALDLAVKTYESLWQESPTPTQRRALEETLETLRGWKL